MWNWLLSFFFPKKEEERDVVVSNDPDVVGLVSGDVPIPAEQMEQIFGEEE
jgi:hypothetical protein